MPPYNRRDKWAARVIKARDLHPNTRLFLSSVLAKHMKSDGTVSYPRRRLAAQMGISERRVSSHIQKAKEAGWLVVVTPGFRTRTAEYQATFPDTERVTTAVTHSEPRKGDSNKHPLWVTLPSPIRARKGDDVCHPTSSRTTRRSGASPHSGLADLLEGHRSLVGFGFGDESNSKKSRNHLRAVGE